MTEPVGWMNGTVVPFSEMALPVWDLGVVAGASLTEMARTYQHKPFELARHIRRLTNSCEELQFSLPYSAEQLETVARELVRQNSALIADTDDLGIVMFVTAGCNATYLGNVDLPGPIVAIHTFRLPLELWKTSAQFGVRLSIPERRQYSAGSLPVHRKTRNRLHWWLADKDADAIEPGSRAILLNDDGHLTETSTSCFFAVIDGTIISPQATVLDSLSRRVVRKLAGQCGIPFEDGDLTPDDIPKFQEAFVSSTPVGIFSVEAINGIFIAPGSQPSVVETLRRQWKEYAGIDPTQQILDGT